ncbi:alpha/beta hydrolase [Actinomadura sp. 6K520]|uniref:alpha/beta hydrolase n=1 Tax=Actinomadura sp. 6K520 TaxID=2530364 RepID=UPI00104598A7|nr:alpha/beta hydrolase [Actinomadura sp. 6K520]TDE35831.1 alpha/beta hydrolase [Actinomadura sp. 6K520]
MRQDIEFVSAGTTLRGWLYTPEGSSGPHPAVVVTHGLGAVKEQYTDDIAEALAAAGLAVVLYDHASFGASDGEPRQEVDPWTQIQGYRDAITFLCTRPEVDAERIGVFGSSFSGGHVLVVGAVDRRVKAVYSQVPVISGGTTLSRFIPSEALAEVRKSFDADRLARFNGEAPAMIPLITATPGEPAAMADRETYEWYQTIEPERLATWRNEVTLRSVEAIAGYEPGDYIARISPTPLMLVVAQHDILTHSDLAFAAYERALHPKRLVTLPGGHFVVYNQEFKNTLALMTEFFLQHLASRTAA